MIELDNQIYGMKQVLKIYSCFYLFKNQSYWEGERKRDLSQMARTLHLGQVKPWFSGSFHRMQRTKHRGHLPLRFPGTWNRGLERRYSNLGQNQCPYGCQHHRWQLLPLSHDTGSQQVSNIIFTTGNFSNQLG